MGANTEERLGNVAVASNVIPAVLSIFQFQVALIGDDGVDLAVGIFVGIELGALHHNLNEANHAIPDPDLTELGKEQCTQLQSVFPYTSRLTHLVASPLRRTIYTCLLSFTPVVKAGIKVIALPEMQETSNLPCDTGSDPEELQREFSEGEWNGTVDLGLVHDGWNDKGKGSKWEPEVSKLEARSQVARNWLRELGQSNLKEGKDADIVVVTHGGLLHYFTQDWEGYEKFSGTGWQNTEFRSYTFVSETDEEASLEETSESRERRRGTEIPLTDTEMRELKSAAQRKWTGSGLIGSGFQASNSSKI